MATSLSVLKNYQENWSSAYAVNCDIVEILLLANTCSYLPTPTNDKNSHILEENKFICKNNNDGG